MHPKTAGILESSLYVAGDSSTPIDLLGPHILHLLKKAEAGALDDAIVREERFQILT